MSPIIAVLFLIGVASATETYDCGPANKIIAINKALITPDPVPYPGKWLHKIGSIIEEKVFFFF